MLLIVVVGSSSIGVIVDRHNVVWAKLGIDLGGRVVTGCSCIYTFFSFFSKFFSFFRPFSGSLLVNHLADGKF